MLVLSIYECELWGLEQSLGHVNYGYIYLRLFNCCNLIIASAATIEPGDSILHAQPHPRPKLAGTMYIVGTVKQNPSPNCMVRALPTKFGGVTSDIIEEYCAESPMRHMHHNAPPTSNPAPDDGISPMIAAIQADRIESMMQIRIRPRESATNPVMMELMAPAEIARNVMREAVSEPISESTTNCLYHENIA